MLTILHSTSAYLITINNTLLFVYSLFTSPTERVPPKRSHRKGPTERVPSKWSHRKGPIERVPPKGSHRKGSAERVPGPGSHFTDMPIICLYIGNMSQEIVSLFISLLFLFGSIRNVKDLYPPPPPFLVISKAYSNCFHPVRWFSI